MDVRKTNIPGCYEIVMPRSQDERGQFTKTFHIEWFEQYGLESNFQEEYYSISYKNVLRGLHFQLPPHDHTKVVYCALGEVIDVVVDLRVESPTFGQFELFNLSADRGNVIYIPPGLAHGFYVTSDEAIMMYKVSTVYSPAHDAGIRWNSLEIPWPNPLPIISQRDQGLPIFQDFVSPFRYS